MVGLNVAKSADHFSFQLFGAQLNGQGFAQHTSEVGQFLYSDDVKGS